MSHSYKSYTDKVNSWGALVGTIVVTFTAIGAVMGIAIVIVHSLNPLCKSTNWDCDYTLEIIISNELIMFFWGLAAAIVGGGGIAISRYKQKIEKLKEKTISSEQEIIESMHRIAKYDKIPHPFTFPQLTYFNIKGCENIGNYILDSEIKANLHHLCRYAIDVIRLRFSREYGNVEFHCVSGYRCTDLNKESNFKEKEWMNTEHEEGKAIDIDISSGSSSSTKSPDSTKPSYLLNELFQFIKDRNNCGDLPLSKVVLVSVGKRHWIHISSSRKDKNIREFYKLVDGK